MPLVEEAASMATVERSLQRAAAAAWGEQAVWARVQRALARPARDREEAGGVTC